MSKRVSQLREILTNPNFQAVEDVAIDLKHKIASQSPKRKTNCDTVYELGKQYGMIEGITLLFQELRKQAQDNND